MAVTDRLRRAFGKRKDSTTAAATQGAAAPSGGAGKTQLKTPTVGKAAPPNSPEPQRVDLQKTKRIQSQVDEVTGIMNTNVADAKKRGENLDDLHGKVQDLEVGAGTFQKKAKQVEKNLWYKNMKMTIALTVVVLVIVAVLIGVAVWQFSSK